MNFFYVINRLQCHEQSIDDVKEMRGMLSGLQSPLQRTVLEDKVMDPEDAED